MEQVADQKVAVSSARGQLMHQKRPKDVSWGNNDQETWTEDTLCVNQMANIPFFLDNLFFPMKWNWNEFFLELEGTRKKEMASVSTAGQTISPLASFWALANSKM